MITVSTAFTDAMTSRTRLWKTKVTITRNNAGASPVDISERVTACNPSFDWERRSATVSIELDNYDYTLSPLNRNSPTNQVAGVFDPLLDSNHLIEVYYSLQTASGMEYVKRFTGYLGDEIDADTFPGTVQLTARDKSKILQDTYVYKSKSYGNPPVPVEYVIQDMINQFASGNGITVQVDTPTLFDIGTPTAPYTAKDVNLWDAVQMLADAANHELKFDENGTLRLKNIIRDFTGQTPVAVFDEDDLIRDSISISDSDVRNHIVLRVQGLNPIEKKNDDSIAKYGRRYMEVHRALASVITNLEQGNKLVDNFLKDLSYATPLDRVEMPFNPIIQVGDFVGINNTKLGTTSDLNIFRVITIRENFSAKNKRTELVLQGHVRFDVVNTLAPKPPTSATVQINQRKVMQYPGSGWSGSERTYYYPLLKWTAPTQDISGSAISPSFGGYTIYRKGPTDTDFKAIGSIRSYLTSTAVNLDYFYDYTAQNGTNSYKVVAVSQFGKRSTDSNVAVVSVPATVTT